MRSKYLSLRILIIDDHDEVFLTGEYIKNISGNSFVVERCHDYKKALNHICKDDYDIYIIDDNWVGSKSGVELIKEAMEKSCEKPFILLTDDKNPQVALEAMNAGAADYLVKSELDTEKLERCIRYAKERVVYINALKENEKKFKNIFNRSIDAVFLLNKEFVFIDVNKATLNLFGYDKKTLLSKNLFQLLANKKEKASILKESDASPNTIDDKEVDFKTKSGEIKHCRLSITEHKNEEKYYQGIIHDITDLKNAEKQNLRIEKRGVADRLVNVLAHEIRNPLNNINLSLEQFREGSASAEEKIYLDIITRNSKRIENIINELLNTSRPVEINRVKQPLQTIIEASLEAAHDRIKLKKIKLIKDIPADPVVLMADADNLKIVIQNIIINAIEAMQEGKGELTIKLENLNAHPQLSIQDNGCGISEENLSKLFEPYFTSKRNGMGLGLATAINILQSHNATVDVKSEVNKGTSFIINFKD